MLVMLGWTLDELHRGVGLGLGEGKGPGPALEMNPLPVSGKVPVHVDPADPILIGPTIPVVVHPLRQHPIAQCAFRNLLLSWRPHPDPRDPNHHSVILWMSVPISFRVRNPHLGDPTVPVQVLRGIFVGFAIFVIVPGPHRTPKALVEKKGQIGTVGIELGTDVEGKGLEKIRHLGIPSIPCEELPQGIEGHLGAGQLPRVDATVQVHGRFLRGRARDLGGDLHDPELPPLETLANAVELGEFGIELMVFPEDLLRLRQRCSSGSSPRCHQGPPGCAPGQVSRAWGECQPHGQSEAGTERGPENGKAGIVSLQASFGESGGEGSEPAEDSPHLGRVFPTIQPPEQLFSGGTFSDQGVYTLPSVQPIRRKQS